MAPCSTLHAKKRNCSIRNALRPFLLFFILGIIANFSSFSQTVLINHNFQVAALPPGVSTDGSVSISKAADGVCTKGMVQVNQGGYMQVDVPANAFFQVNMKSTSSSARTLRITYKKEGEGSYNTLSLNLMVSAAAAFLFHELYRQYKPTRPSAFVLSW